MRLLLPVFLLAVAIVGPATAYTPDTLTVTFLDVGQGDSVLVQAPNGRAMLVDAGESWAAPAVSAGLAVEGISRLENVVATHDHADHIGGMTGVLPLPRRIAGERETDSIRSHVTVVGTARKMVRLRIVPVA